MKSKDELIQEIDSIIAWLTWLKNSLEPDSDINIRMNNEGVAEFYSDIFGLKITEKKA
jgi:hypothetical protein